MIYKLFSCFFSTLRDLLSKEMHTKLTNSVFVHSDWLLKRLFNVVPLPLQEEEPGVRTTNLNCRIQCQRKISCRMSYLVHQPLKQPIGPRSARPCPDPQLTQALGRHMSTEHWSRARSALHTVVHVPRDAAERTIQSTKYY